MIKPYFMIQINQYKKCERPSSAHCFLHDVCFKKLEGFPFLRKLRQCLALDGNKRHEYSSTADRAAWLQLVSYWPSARSFEESRYTVVSYPFER